MNVAPKRDSYDVVVIGAGPAGLAAAATAAEADLSALLLDENAGPGGQVWRAIASTPVTERDRLGADYWAGAELVRAVRTSGAEIIQRATVWSLDRHLEVGVSIGGASSLVKARRVILATGALERPFPIPGWTLPGVMTAGAAQTMLKSSGLVPDGRTVIAGQGPLLWLLAAQILRLGGRIDRILDTTERRNYFAALPHAFAFMTSPYFAKGLAMMREVRAKVPVVSGVSELAAAGDGQLATVTYAVGSRRETIPAELLLLHQGVVPNVNLAMAAGVEHRWDDLQLCWSPVLDHNGSASVEGIGIAGDGAGIGGAGAAIVRGHIAARVAVEALAPAAAAKLAPMATFRASLAQAERGRAFLDTLFRPARQFRIPSGDTVVCRCEEVTAKDIVDAVAIGATGPNQLKAYRRSGMGPCQGRLCGLTVTELMAQARGKTPQEIGYYRLRAPVKPITLAELAAVPKTEADVQAVVRG
ncbi:NAD(P)/FAD-dependent oxidoreductase [Bradyrhizobium valentinum]|uniref:FAD/NAD(P)-binding oxidoreductase n=1 Tax=Bradyrhizobium valentinum TaxID=1518501 RepID=A0A0R3L593_9BRAD|nr:NAD(P)/FAD-dependent oxidoreductase [Bradyrhizobium valentinum]KRR03089.1 FAD/NAD(P)-binding oxidoreductase [Bradyrhizobium valentinum]KRR14022.1 FAD/NAD(P)-binding oxidoreductase [Bradyrhizobium valentinum]